MVCIIHMTDRIYTAEFYRKENRNITAKIKITGFKTRTSKSADLKTSFWLQKSLSKTAYFHSNLTSWQLFHSQLRNQLTGKNRKPCSVSYDWPTILKGIRTSKQDSSLFFFKVDIFAVKELNRKNFYFSRNRLYFPSLFQKIRTKLRKFLIC